MNLDDLKVKRLDGAEEFDFDKEPDYDIYDEKLANKQYEEFLLLAKENEEERDGDI